MKRTMFLVACRLGLFAISTACLLGCGGQSPPTAADPQQAQETLRTALDAWKNGSEAGSLQQRAPAIHVSEPRWEGGYQLVEFEMAEGPQPMGADLRCEVVLTLKDKNGKSLREKAAYLVGTTPALTVVREGDF